MIHLIRPRRSLVLVCLVSGLSACNFKEEKNKDDSPSETVSIDPSKPISFADIQTQILVPSCVTCHSSSTTRGGVNLETYAAVKDKIDAIKRTTVDSTLMPQGDTLSKDRVALLKTWIEKGAPE